MALKDRNPAHYTELYEMGVRMADKGMGSTGTLERLSYGTEGAAAIDDGYRARIAHIGTEPTKK